MQQAHLLKSAFELVEAINRTADENLPGQLAGIVKLHAGLAVARAFIPVPGADMAAAGLNIWTMYVRINKELGLPFAENVLKSLATGVLTNLAGAAASILLLSGFIKLFPGVGSVAGAALMAGTAYAITIASGIVYMRAVAALIRRKGASANTTAEDLKSAADEILRDKGAVKSMLNDAKAEYDSTKK